MKLYSLMKTGREGQYNVRDRESGVLAGTLSGSGATWSLTLFGKAFKLKSKAKALGTIRGMFAARAMIEGAFPVR